LEKCSESMKEQKEYEEQAEKDINDHFARCIEAIAARKAALLDDLVTKATSKSM
jgi:hypothetical protein